MRAEKRIWWDQATADLQTTEVNLRADCYYASVFFAQQAVEKALKALVLKKKRNPQAPEMFSHSLIYLAETCRLPDKFHSFLSEGPNI